MDRIVKAAKMGGNEQVRLIAGGDMVVAEGPDNDYSGAVSAAVPLGVTVRLKTAYLLDVCKAVGRKGSLTLRRKGDRSAAALVFTSADDPSRQCTVMPITEPADHEAARRAA